MFISGVFSLTLKRAPEWNKRRRLRQTRTIWRAFTCRRGAGSGDGGLKWQRFPTCLTEKHRGPDRVCFHKHDCVSNSLTERAWCHGTTFLRRPEGTMSVKTKYPHFRLKEPRVVQADRLIYRKASPNCQHGFFWGACLPLVIGHHCVTLLRHPVKFWTSDVHVTLLLFVCACACVFACRSKHVG